MSNLPSNSLQEGEHNFQEMKTKYPAWSSKGYHMYVIANIGLVVKHVNSYPFPRFKACKGILNYCFIFISVNAKLANLYSTTRINEALNEVGLVGVGWGRCREKGNSAKKSFLLFLYFLLRK